MAAPKGPRKRQIAIRKGATEVGIIAELVSLLETVTADGVITDIEADELRAWLEQNRDSDLPAIDFLRTTLEQILADSRITTEERRALHLAVERVLPAELREKAKGRRVANELLEKAREREQRAASRARDAEERAKSRSVYSVNFMVAGVAYEGRSGIVDRYLQTGQIVFLARDPGNPYDGNAVEIRLREGHQIGFVPREDAREMAPLLDAGYKQSAYCTKILNGRRTPIPVIQADLYRADAMVAGAINSGEVPARSSMTASARTSSAAAVGCLIGLLLLFLFFFVLFSR